MTIQDYISLSQESLSNFSVNFFPTFANILAATVALAVGILLGWILKRVVELISDAVNLERSLQNLRFYDKLVKSHANLDLTNFIGEIARWSAIVIFLIPAIASLQIEGADLIFSQLFAYITNVVLASLYLLFGFVLAWFVHKAVTAAGTLMGNHPAHLVANLAYVAFVAFASLQALVQLGVTEEFIRYILLAVIVAGALAFGLAGRDTATDWIKKITNKSK